MPRELWRASAERVAALNRKLRSHALAQARCRDEIAAELADVWSSLRDDGEKGLYVLARSALA